MKGGLMLMACFGIGQAGYLDSLAGTSVHSFDEKAYCSHMGKTYQGYSWRAGGGKATIKITCSGTKMTVKCTYQGENIISCSDSGGSNAGSPTPSPSSPTPPAPTPAPAPASGPKPGTTSTPPPSGPAPTPAPAGYQNTVSGVGCSDLTTAEAQTLLDLHNKMRCTVGSPPIKWNPALACQAQQDQNKINAFEHNNGEGHTIQAGENLATGTGMANAAWMWFTEYMQGPCNQAFSSHCGHYTAMSWKATTELGCGIGRDSPTGFGSKGVIRCQYAAVVPNMQGQFPANVPNFLGEQSAYDKCGLSFDEAKTNAAKYKQWGILNPTSPYGSSVGLYEAGLPTMGAWLSQSMSAMMSAGVVFALLSFFTATISFLRWRRQARPTWEELAPVGDDEEMYPGQAAE